MRAYVIPGGRHGIDELRIVDRPEPRAAATEVVIGVRAASLNARDQAILNGTYFVDAGDRDLVPLSDGAGEVIAVGCAVTRFKLGDRVAGLFFQPGPAGTQRALGLPLDGVLAEQIALSEEGVVPLPSGYSYEEGACLPCAGLTAWHALMHAGRPTRPGDAVLVLGTGGVATFALQFARCAGARVIVTSSSDEKLRHATALGASDGINYHRTPGWEKQVMQLTAGRGVDCVVEVGGSGTLRQSFHCLARGGKVALIGFLASPSRDPSPHSLMFKSGSLHGIAVGDGQMFEQMTRAIEVNAIKPVIDTILPFDRAQEAFRRQSSGQFVGKIVVRL